MRSCTRTLRRPSCTLPACLPRCSHRSRGIRCVDRSITAHRHVCGHVSAMPGLLSLAIDRKLLLLMPCYSDVRPYGLSSAVLWVARFEHANLFYRQLFPPFCSGRARALTPRHPRTGAGARAMPKTRVWGGAQPFHNICK